MNKRYRDRIIESCALVWIVPAVCVADSNPTIKRNPFERPTMEALEPNPVSTGDRPDEEWSPKLHAVLVSGSKSLANLGGIVVQIGETANGYQLVSVGEGVAIFERNDERVVLSVFENDRSKRND